MKRILYKELSNLVSALTVCTAEWEQKHRTRIAELCLSYMPRGCGFDVGAKLLIEKSTQEKLVFATEFHHMNSDGFYDGWTSHIVTVKPSLFYDFKLSISGINRNDIKDTIYECFDLALREEWEE